MSTKKQKNDWKAFKTFERMGFIVAFFISWIVLVSTPLDLLFQYLSPTHLSNMYNFSGGFMSAMAWFNDFFGHWRDVWQWPVIFYSLFFVVGRVIFKDWNKTNLLVWVSFVIAYLNLIFFNTSFNASEFTFAIAGFTFYPMIILAPANTNIYPEFGALLLIAGYDLLKRVGFDSYMRSTVKVEGKPGILDKDVNPEI